MLIAYERPWKATIHSPFHFFAGRVGLQGGHARALLWQKQTASPRHGSGAKFGQWASDSQIWQITKTSTTSCNTKLVWNVKALAMEMISTTILCVARRCFLVRSLCPWLWVGALRCVCAVVLLHNWNVFWNISAKIFSAEFGPTVWILNPCVECFFSWKLFRSGRKKADIKSENFIPIFVEQLQTAQNSMHFTPCVLFLHGVKGGCTILWKRVSSACQRSLRHRVTEWHATEQLPSQKSI